MADFKITDSGINEQRDFSNPHIRFIRRNGKVIPIVNKKRIGQELNSAGGNLIKAGSVVGAASLLKMTKPAKKFSEMFKNSMPTVPKFRPKSLGGNVLSKTVRAGLHLLKHSGKYGAGAAVIGLGALLSGTELQMRSAFGKDLFFIKDEHGMGN